MKTLYKFFTTALLIISINSVGQNLISSNSTNEGGAIELINPLKTANNIANKWVFYNMTGPYGNSLQFWNYGNNNFYGSRFTILDNGNVGVGITTPDALLDVNGKAVVRSSFYTNEIKGYNGGNITIGPNTGGPSSTIFMIGGFDATEVMRVNYDKNVGIGTTNPDSKLTVKGKIHAEEVKIDLAVPADYVFEKYYLGKSSLKPDYTLLTLSEVEKFTEENHHLPNVPSAKDMKENGVQLGEMSNVLLQKIEELTLYSIEQQKTIEKQAAAIDKLKKENESFKKLEERLIRLETEVKTKK